MGLKECIADCREVRAKHGYSLYDMANKTLNRERVNPEREKRQKFPPSMYQRLYDRQGGNCPVCKNRLDVPAKRNEIDHIDPNRTDFNHQSNLQLAHRACNRSKSSKSILEQSKETGQSFTEILRAPLEDEI